MPPQGSAFLALWNDFDPARDDEYNCWHSFEHVPERVGIPGVLAARRYVARERADDRYFTLYELNALATLREPDYAEVVAHPTAWSLAMRPSFRNFRREPCATVWSAGIGIGAAIATIRFHVHTAAAAPDAATARAALDAFVEAGGVTAIHLGRAEPDPAFPMPNAPMPDGAVPGAPCVLLVEALSRAELDAVAPRIAAACTAAFGASQPVASSFDLAHALTKADLRHPAAPRQPARPDLRAQWTRAEGEG